MAYLSYPIPSRLLYAGLWCLALPAALAALLYRSLAQPAYRRFLGERFACHAGDAGTAPIWLHAASLGEVQAAAPLLAALRAAHPGMPLLISCQTPAGRQAAQALALADCRVRYLPFDLRLLMRRFLRRVRPRIVLVFETEIWPNLFLETRRAGVPLMMVNARITERSLRRYRRLGIFRAALALPEAIACQSRADAGRFIAAGAHPDAVCVTGNLKWDLAVDDGRRAQAEARRAQWPQRPVWVAASTHPEEEAVVLDIHRALLAQSPDALLLWAPRHPERFAPALALAQSRGFSTACRSRERGPDAGSQVFVIDTLGELAGFLPGTDAVFVGGSLQAIGGHNVLEPAAFGVPVLVGPHTAHFAEAVAALKSAGGLLQEADAGALQAALLALLADARRCRRMGEANARCVAESRGALEKTKALVSQRLVS